MPSDDVSHVEELAKQLEADLLRLHGPLLGGEALYRALGYPTATAFRQALAKKSEPVAIFKIKQRRGRFALTKDVAGWLAACRCTSAAPCDHGAVRADGR